MVKQVVSFLSRQRTDESFCFFYTTVLQETKHLTQPPTMPRQRRIPRRYNDGCEDHVFTSPEELYRKEYYQAFDVVIGELNRRFDVSSFTIMKEIENVLIQSFSGAQVLFSDQFNSLYSGELNLERLKLQLMMLPDLLKAANETEPITIRKVTSIGTIIDLMTMNSFSQSFLSEVNALLRIYLTVPMATATAERTFSSLRRLKTYLRSTMTQIRLNNITLTYTHRDRLERVDLTDIAKKFISSNERRRNFFGLLL